MPRSFTSTARPWTPNRTERQRAGAWQWWGFAPGAAVRCPSCEHFVTELGAALGVECRVHPGGKSAKPTERLGQAVFCGGCNLRLELRVSAVGEGGVAA